jgi:protein-tyrosine phosphatase
MKYNKIKMYEILPGKLYQRGEFATFPFLVKEAALSSYGITMIANLVSKTDPDLQNTEPYFYWNYPIPDNKLTEKIKENLLEYAKTFAKRIRDGKTAALVHCHAGRNRSALFSALIVMFLTGMSGKESVKYVREKRPNALANEKFVEWLESIDELTIC